MVDKFFSLNTNNLDFNQPKLDLSHSPRIRVKSDIPTISLQDDDNLFFNIDGSDYSMNSIADSFGNLFFSE